jgi:hypothetical protein
MTYESRRITRAATVNLVVDVHVMAALRLDFDIDYMRHHT